MEQNYYENTTDAQSYYNYTNNVQKPLQNELDVLRYAKLMTDQVKDNNLFDPKEEADKIYSGYYLDIHDSLNILREYHDNIPNPFKDFHEEAVDYLKFLEQQNEEPWMQQKDIFSACYTSNDEFETCSTSSHSLIIVTDDEETNEPPVAKEPTVKRKRGRPPKSNCQKQLYKSNKPAKKPKPSTKVLEESSDEIVLESMSNSSSEIPIIDHFSLEYLNPSNNYEEHFKLLQSLKDQYNGATFVENGKTMYPILTNENFKNISYDLDDEILNNQIIQKNIFNNGRFFKSSKHESHLHLNSESLASSAKLTEAQKSSMPLAVFENKTLDDLKFILHQNKGRRSLI